MVPLTGQNTINDMVDRINEVSQEIENVAVSNANAVVGPASSVADQIMAFSDTTGKNAKAANISPFVYSVLDDVDDAAVRVTLGLKSSAILDAATAATPSTVVQRDASGNITGVGITATSGFVGNGSQITSLNVSNAASGTLATAYGGTGTTSATGTGSTVRNTSPTFAGAPLSTTAAADTNTTQIATTAFVVGQASSTSPVMDGTATVGTSLRYARADHVHPSDTSKVNTSLLGVANGVATLDSAGKVPTSQLPAYVDDVLEYANLASFPATGETGKIYVALDTNKTYRWSGSTYIYITSGAVDSVAGKTGVVSLAKGDVGLGNVDNTSDATKSIGGNAATATKLGTSRTISATGDATWSASFDGSANATGALTLANSGVTAGTYPKVTVDAKGRVTAGAALAAADVPALDAAKITSGVFADARLSGTYTGVNITGNAATATKLETARTLTLGSSGKTFDGSANVSWTLAEMGAAPLSSPALTGTPTVPTAADGTSTDQAASTAFVQAAIGGYLSKAVTGGTVTLTASEASNPVIGLSGTLTSNLILEIPASALRIYSISNGTTGAFTVSIKVVGLAPTVLVAQGKRNLVYTNGIGAYDAITDFDSIALSGAPTAPTAAVGTNTTQIATTAFVNAEIANDAPTKTGGGASGTWSIDISGNAATVTTLSGLTASVAELNYCDGVTSNIQTQLNGKASSSHTHSYLPLAGGNITGSTNFADSVQAQFGTGDDLIIQHNGAHSYIDQNVTGDLYIRNNRTSGRVLIYADDSAAVSQVQAQFGDATNNGVILYCAGTARFQTTTAGATVTGAFTASGNITAYSDIRLKTDIQVIPDALAKVQALRGVTYERVDTGEHQTGVIAQEVQAVLPEAVDDSGEYLSVGYGSMTGLLIEAIKELTARVEELKNGAA